MKTVRLGEIAESLPCDYGDDPVDDAPTFDVVKVSNVSGEGQFHGHFEKRRFRDDQIENLLVKEGELLVVKSSGSKANILSGKTAICGPDRSERIVASNFLLRLRVDEAAASPRFLWYVLNSRASKSFVKTIVGASTYPNLKWSLYASHPIPLPPLAEQRRIAEVLDRAEALRAKRRAALAHLDSLTQSLFLDLFGKLKDNPKGWPLAPLMEICSPKQWPTISTPELTETGFPVFGANGLIGCYTEYNHEEPTVLITCRGATCGTINVSPPKCYVTGNAMALDNPDPQRITIEYLAAVLRMRSMADTISGTAQPQITRQNLQHVKLPLPPIEKQREFARRVTAVERLKTAHRASLAELDALFASPSTAPSAAICENCLL